MATIEEGTLKHKIFRARFTETGLVNCVELILCINWPDGALAHYDEALNKYYLLLFIFKYRKSGTVNSPALLPDFVSFDCPFWSTLNNTIYPTLAAK